MSWPEALLEFLDILTKPHVIAVLLIAYLLRFHRQGLGEWLKDLKSVTLPGGAKFEMDPRAQRPEVQIEPVKRKVGQAKIEELKELASFWKNYWHFEWVWGYIYRSQIEILEELHMGKSEGSSTSGSLYNFYLKANKANPTLSSIAPYDSYMSWLENNKLITIERDNTNSLNSRVKITDYGTRFLLYLNKVGHRKEGRMY